VVVAFVTPSPTTNFSFFTDDGVLPHAQLLNRNPKHRLGAQRDAEELKEHPFFKPIDWKKLALKQVEPPFKPTVESDESVANFDTEFTSADVTTMGIEFDENDPSEAWTTPSITSPHTPNGPLGSDRLPTGSVPSVSTLLSNLSSQAPSNSAGTGITIAKTKKNNAQGAHSPISHSMQENFKGFTFSGGESLAIPQSLAQRVAATGAEEDAVDVEEEEPTTEDEVDDDETAGGRYARKRRGDDDLMDM
jgi:serine/threonine protein kinase SCH9